MASQTKRPLGDNNADGLVDGRKKVQLATEQGPLNLRRWSGDRLSTSTKNWNVVRAVDDGPGYRILFKGQGRRQSQYKVLEVNAAGVINGSDKYPSTTKALKGGLEGVFGDVIQKDGSIGYDPQPDADGNGFVDRLKGRAYKLLSDTDSKPITLKSKEGDPLSSDSSNRWDAVQAVVVENGFQVLLQKGKRSKSAFQLLDVDQAGVITAKSSWLPAVEALLAGWDARFKEAILAKDSSGGGIKAASVDDDAPVGQLIYSASVEDSSAVTFTLEPLNEVSLAGLSIDAANGEVRLDPAALLPLPDSIGFVVVATDQAGNSNRLDVQVSLSQAIVGSDESSTEAEGGVSALSVDESLLDDDDSGADESDIEGDVEPVSEEILPEDGDTSDGDVESPGDESSVETPQDPVEVSGGITLSVVVDSESDGVTNDNTPVFSGVATAASTIEVLAGDVVLGSAEADESGAWSLALADNEALSEGTFIFTARELTTDGGDPSSSEASSLTIDQTAPEFTSESQAEATIELTSAQLDADGDGLLDESNGSKIVGQGKIIQISGPKGKIFSGSSDN